MSLVKVEAKHWKFELFFIKPIKLTRSCERNGRRCVEKIKGGEGTGYIKFESFQLSFGLVLALEVACRKTNSVFENQNFMYMDPTYYSNKFI